MLVDPGQSCRLPEQGATVVKMGPYVLTFSSSSSLGLSGPGGHTAWDKKRRPGLAAQCDQVSPVTAWRVADGPRATACGAPGLGLALPWHIMQLPPGTSRTTAGSFHCSVPRADNRGARSHAGKGSPCRWLPQLSSRDQSSPGFETPRSCAGAA